MMSYFSIRILFRKRSLTGVEISKSCMVNKSCLYLLTVLFIIAFTFIENSTWSSWYIPTGRLENPPYNYSSVIESSVAQTFRTLGYYVPSIGHLKKLRQRLNIKCLLPYDNSFNFTYSCGNII